LTALASHVKVQARMRRWRVDRAHRVEPSPGLGTEFAYLMYLEADREETQTTIEWVDRNMGSESAAYYLADSYLQTTLKEGERPARRLIVAPDGTVSVAEPA
jgi:hypothetical protein